MINSKNKIINTNNGKISYIIKESFEKKGIVIFCHGLGGNKQSKKANEIGENLLEIGFSYIMFDFFGHGESSGNFKDTEPSKSEFGLNVIYNLVSDMGYSNIGVCGNSYGAAVAMGFATRNNIQFLILRSPVSDYKQKELKKKGESRIKSRKDKGYCIKDLGSGPVKLGYQFLKDMGNYIGTKIGKKISCPTLIIHGSDDEQIPFQQSVALNQTIKNSKLIIINGADHRFSNKNHFLEQKQHILCFIKNMNPNE